MSDMQDNTKTSYETGASQDNTPVIPLPNPGEGGPVHPGNTNGNIQDNTPVILLPNPGEGGPVYPGNMNNQGNNNINNMLSNIIGTIISTHPRPNVPCRLCNSSSTRSGYIRFLNAATGYNPFVIFVNDSMISDNFNFAEVTDYERISDGRQIVTVMGENGYIYVINRSIYRTKLTPGMHRDEYEIRLYLIYGMIDDDRFKYLGTKMISESTELSVSPCLTNYNGKYILMQLYTNCYNDGVSFDGLKYQTYDKIEDVGTNVVRKTIQVNIDKYIPWHMSLFHYEGGLYAIISCVQKGIDHKCYQMLGRFTTDLNRLTIFDKPLTDYNSYRGAAYINSEGDFCLYSTTVNEKIKYGYSIDGREVIYAHKRFQEILNKMQ